MQEISHEVVDEVLLIDDYSKDETVQIAQRLGLRIFLQEKNFGYGRNQKTCYTEALRTEADVVVMLHPDYQYQPRLVLPIAALITTDVYDLVVASRILGGKARSGGMPFYKYVANRVLTLFQNFLVGAKLSEYHSGYRAFSRKVLLSLPLLMNRTTLFLITKCWCRRFTSDTALEKSPVRRITFPRPRPSTFAGV